MCRVLGSHCSEATRHTKPHKGTEFYAHKHSLPPPVGSPLLLLLLIVHVLGLLSRRLSVSRCPVCSVP